MCFLSELLETFEVQKPDFVKPAHTVDLTGTNKQSNTPNSLTQHYKHTSSNLLFCRCIRSARLHKSNQWHKQQVKHSQSAPQITLASLRITLDKHHVFVSQRLPVFHSETVDPASVEFYIWYELHEIQSQNFSKSK